MVSIRSKSNFAHRHRNTQAPKHIALDLQDLVFISMFCNEDAMLMCVRFLFIFLGFGSGFDYVYPFRLQFFLRLYAHNHHILNSILHVLSSNREKMLNLFMSDEVVIFYIVCHFIATQIVAHLQIARMTISCSYYFYCHIDYTIAVLICLFVFAQSFFFTRIFSSFSAFLSISFLYIFINIIKSFSFIWLQFISFCRVRFNVISCL